MSTHKVIVQMFAPNGYETWSGNMPQEKVYEYVESFPEGWSMGEVHCAVMGCDCQADEPEQYGTCCADPLCPCPK